MQTILAYGYAWRWNESLTVNVNDGYSDVYCYTLGETGRQNFVNSIPEVWEYLREMGI